MAAELLNSAFVSGERERLLREASELQRQASAKQREAMTLAKHLLGGDAAKIVVRTESIKKRENATLVGIHQSGCFVTSCNGALDETAVQILGDRIEEITEEIDALTRQRQALKNVLSRHGVGTTNNKPRVYCMLCGRRFKVTKKTSSALLEPGLNDTLMVSALVNGMETTVRACSSQCREEAKDRFDRRIEWQRQELRSLSVVRKQMETITAASKDLQKASQSQPQASRQVLSSQG